MNDSKAVNTTPVFQKNLAAYLGGFSIICNEGGSRSGKTYSIIQLLCGIAQQNPGIRISIVSHSLPHIKRGAFRDFKLIMHDCGWWNEDNWRATDFYYTMPNGSYIELFGLEDESKARGPGRDILFINEANLVHKMVFDQLAMRTTKTIFMDWNPAEFNSWVYDVSDNPKNKKIHSTYLDNIHNLSEIQIQYIEGYKDLPDSFMWDVYGLGLRGASKELIYTGWKLCNELPGKGDVFFGLDFGYTVPTSLVSVENYDGSNYVKEVIYLSGITTPELIERMKAAGVSTELIYCDAAEPDRIDELIKAGFNAKKAVKDVVAGIVKVKSYPLYLTTDSKNLISEMNGYKWATDNNGEILDDKPVKANDHATDAMRYAIMTHLNAPTLQYWAI
jgi:phage terminase large subunit